MRFELKAKRDFKAELRKVLEAEAERRGKIEAEARTVEEMEEEDLEGGTMRSEEVEVRLGVMTEVLERSDDETKWREVKEALGRAEEG